MAKKKYKGPAKLDLNSSELFTYVVGLVAVFSVLTWLITGLGQRTETSDKATYLMAGFAGFVFIIQVARKKINRELAYLFNGAAWLSISVGILIIEHRNMSREHPMGFGVLVTLLTVVLLPVTIKFLNSNLNISKKIKFALLIPSSIVVILVAVSFFQTRTTMTNAPHSEYVLNEIWAPASGINPYQEFIPQYTFLIGWLVKPILMILGPVSGSDFLVLLMTAFAFLCTFLMVYMSKKAFPEMSWLIIILAALPFCTPSPGWNRISFVGPATTILSGPSLRIFGGMIVGGLIVWAINRQFNEKKYRFAFFLSGVVSAAVIWNNLDFGLAAMVAAVLVTAIYCFAIPGMKKDSLYFLLGGLISGNALVYIYLALQNGIPNWSYFGWFMRSFGAGFGAVTIEMPGPVNLDFPLIVGTAAIGIAFLILKSKSSSFESNDLIVNQRNMRSAITASYFGAFAAFGLPYYVNRSYHSGQMSILYFPLAVSLISVIGLLWRTKNLSKQNLSAKFPALLLAFMIATVAIIPSPNWELRRLNGENPDATFPRQPVADLIQEAPKYIEVAKSLGKSISYFGEEGNYFELKTGIKSSNIFNSPFDGFQNKNAVEVMCKKLKETGGEILVMTKLTEQTFAWNDKSLCEGLYYLYQDNRLGTVGLRSPLKSL